MIINKYIKINNLCLYLYLNNYYSSIIIIKINYMSNKNKNKIRHYSNTINFIISSFYHFIYYKFIIANILMNKIIDQSIINFNISIHFFSIFNIFLSFSLIFRKFIKYLFQGSLLYGIFRYFTSVFFFFQ